MSSAKTNTFNAKNIDPYILADKLQSILEKPVVSKIDLMMTKMIKDEFSRTKNITREEYNILCEKTGTS